MITINDSLRASYCIIHIHPLNSTDFAANETQFKPMHIYYGRHRYSINPGSTLIWSWRQDYWVFEFGVNCYSWRMLWILQDSLIASACQTVGLIMASTEHKPRLLRNSTNHTFREAIGSIRKKRNLNFIIGSRAGRENNPKRTSNRTPLTGTFSSDI